MRGTSGCLKILNNIEKIVQVKTRSICGVRRCAVRQPFTVYNAQNSRWSESCWLPDGTGFAKILPAENCKETMPACKHRKNTPRGCLFRRLCAIVLHMWLFLFAVLPLAVCGSYVAIRSVRPNALIGAYPLLAFYGLVVGAAVCFVGFFFIYSADTVADSVQRQALPYLLYRELLPLLAYAFFALVSRDGAVYVSRAAFPILGGFYTAYLPYYVFSSVVFDSGFGLFCVPLMTLCFICGVSACARFAGMLYARRTSYRGNAGALAVRLCVCMVFFVWLCIVPAYVWGLYLTAMYTSAWQLWAALYCVITPAVCAFSLSDRCKTFAAAAKTAEISAV